MIGTAGASLGKWARYLEINDAATAYTVNQKSTGGIVDYQASGVSKFSVTATAITFGAAISGGDFAWTDVGDMTFHAGSILASGSTNGDTLLIKANDTTFITLTTGATDACTIASPTITTPVIASLYQATGGGLLSVPASVGTDTFCLLGATQELDGKTLDSSVAKGTWTASGTWTIPAVTLGGAISGNSQNITALGTVASTVIANTTANDNNINAAPTATTLTMANAKSCTAIGSNIILPAIVPVANGAGITLTGLNLGQGAITNAADSEAITVKPIIITGAAGAALETGVYTWTGIDITTPAQAANGATNAGRGIKITGGAKAGGASAYQYGLDITMAASTDRAINVATGLTQVNGFAALLGGSNAMTFLKAADAGARNVTFQDVSDTVAVLGTAQSFTATQTFRNIAFAADAQYDIGASGARAFNAYIRDIFCGNSITGGANCTFGLVTLTGISNNITGNITANNQSVNPTPAATTLTAANGKSYTCIGNNIILPAIVPSANGAGITLTGKVFAQGAITNAADSENITVRMITATGAAGQALATGVYSWTWADITLPAQAANGAVNVAIGIKIIGGVVAGGAGAYQRGIDITMAAVTDDAIKVTTGKSTLAGCIFPEMAAPTAVANAAFLFAQDNGAGKTQLMVLMPTGAAIQLAIET